MLVEFSEPRFSIYFSLQRSRPAFTLAAEASRLRGRSGRFPFGRSDACFQCAPVGPGGVYGCDDFLRGAGPTARNRREAARWRYRINADAPFCHSTFGHSRPGFFDYSVDRTPFLHAHIELLFLWNTGLRFVLISVSLPDSSAPGVDRRPEAVTGVSLSV